MLKKIRENRFRFIFLGAAFFCFLLISAPPGTFAAGPTGFPAPKVFEGIFDPDALIYSGTFKILAKGKDAVVVNEQNFIITEKTVIRDMFESVIGLEQLFIPCEAEITYQIRPDQNPICIEIKVKRLL